MGCQVGQKYSRLFLGKYSIYGVFSVQTLGACSTHSVCYANINIYTSGDKHIVILVSTNIYRVRVDNSITVQLQFYSTGFLMGLF